MDKMEKMGASTRPAPGQSPGMFKLRRFFFRNILLVLTLFGVVLGFGIGFAFRMTETDENTISLVEYPGEIFIRSLKLMILPLIITSLISGSASLNMKTNNKIAVRTLVYFLTTSIFNAFLGICLVVAIHPGNPNLKNIVEGQAKVQGSTNLLDSLLDLGRNIFPDNLFQSAFQQTHTIYIPNQRVPETNSSDTGDFKYSINQYEKTKVLNYRYGTNTIGIVVFCLFFGTILGTIGERGRIVVDFFSAIFEVVMRIVRIISYAAPIGICSAIAGKILSVKHLDELLSQLGWFIATIALGVFLYQLVISQLIYFIIVQKNPYKFYIKLMDATVTAFATASTAAALPLTFHCMTEKLKVDPRITRFVLPIGCNTNMDGTALFIAVSSIFIAQMNGIELGYDKLFLVLLSATIASVSSASVPSAALVLLLLSLSAIDVPTDDVNLLFAIDWLVDRIRTTNNMLGDCYAAAIVEKLSMKELNPSDDLKSDINHREYIETPSEHRSDSVVLEMDAQFAQSPNCDVTKLHEQNH